MSGPFVFVDQCGSPWKLGELSAVEASEEDLFAAAETQEANLEDSWISYWNYSAQRWVPLRAATADDLQHLSKMNGMPLWLSDLYDLISQKHS